MGGVADKRMGLPVSMLILLTNSNPPPVAALVAIGAGYVAFKSIKRFSTTDKATYASIHSLWGSSISVALALVGAWWFIKIKR